MDRARSTSGHYPVIELVHSQHKLAEKVDHRWGQADLGRIGLQAVMGGRAFRNYQALSNRVGLNVAGNFRGMVVSARWKVLFRHTSHVGEYMENVGYLAALASGIAESAPKIETILASSDSSTLKGMQIAATASTIAQRALLGVVPAGAHIIYRSLEGWCRVVGLAGGKAEFAASQCVNTLKYADTLVQTTFKTVTDTSNQSKAVWSVIDVVTSAFPGRLAP
ncbi:MAG TPA: hypothetical protein VKX49_21525 [Bryobacteraceae bacterium]|nr:hypothetical protein [Bryobacteraceae bacterium]